MKKEAFRKQFPLVTLFFFLGLVVQLANISNAAIVIIDVPDNNSITEQRDIAGRQTSIRLWIVNSRAFGYLFSNRAGEFGHKLSSLSQGESLITGRGRSGVLINSILYIASSQFVNSATTGKNYIRADSDGNGVAETVFELDFGLSASDFSDDLITRIAYDDTGASLDVPAALISLNSIPEPHSAFLCISALAMIGLRRKR